MTHSYICDLKEFVASTGTVSFIHAGSRSAAHSWAAASGSHALLEKKDPLRGSPRPAPRHTVAAKLGTSILHPKTDSVVFPDYLTVTFNSVFPRTSLTILDLPSSPCSCCPGNLRLYIYRNLSCDLIFPLFPAVAKCQGSLDLSLTGIASMEVAQGETLWRLSHPRVL